MFFITYEWSNQNGFYMKDYFFCDPENTFNFNSQEFAMIFQNANKKKNVIEKKIDLSLKRRSFNGVELLIKLDENFQNYEIQIFSEMKSNEPFISSIFDQESFFAYPLQEGVCYKARVRGINKEDNYFSKWSDEIPFYSLKSNVTFL